MQPRRIDADDDLPMFGDRERSIILAAETLRHSSVSPHAAEPNKGDDRISLFWRVFGGTIISVVVLIIVTAIQSIAGSLREHRTDIAKLHELVGDCAKKDDVQQRTTKLWERVMELKTLESSVSVAASRTTALEAQSSAAATDHKELVNVVAALTTLREKDATLEKQLKDAEAERKDLCREMQTLRERLAKFEGQHEAKPAKPAAKSGQDG